MACTVTGTSFTLDVGWSARESRQNDERTPLRFSRISIARCADLIRSSASAWGPLSLVSPPRHGSTRHGPRSLRTGPSVRRRSGTAEPSALCVTLYAGRHFCVVGPEAVEELRGLRGPPREPMPASLTTTHQGSRDVHCCRFDAPPRTTGVPPNPIVPVPAVTTAHACRISVRAIVEGPRGRAAGRDCPARCMRTLPDRSHGLQCAA